MHALVQEMVFCFIAARSPKTQNRNRLSFNVSEGDLVYHYLLIPIFNLHCFSSLLAYHLGIDTPFIYKYIYINHLAEWDCAKLASSIFP